MNYEEALKKYKEDADFHTLVDLFYSFRIQNKFTLDEMKQALVFSVTKFEMEHGRPEPLTINVFKKTQHKD